MRHFSVIDEAGRTHGPFTLATITELNRRGAPPPTAALVEHASGMLLSLRDVLRGADGIGMDLPSTHVDAPVADDGMSAVAELPVAVTNDAATRQRERTVGIILAGGAMVISALMYLSLSAGTGSGRTVTLRGDMAIFCPDLPTIRDYVEQDHERFGGNGCSLLSPADFAHASVLSEDGDYLHLRVTSQSGRTDEGYVKQSSVNP